MAENTVEGRVLSKLLTKLEEIRAALGDRLFDVIGQPFPALQSQSGIPFGHAPPTLAKRQLVAGASRQGLRLTAFRGQLLRLNEILFEEMVREATYGKAAESAILFTTTAGTIWLGQN